RELPSDHSNAGFERDGQGRLLQDTTISVSNAAREKRSSLDARIERMVELVRGFGQDQFIVWCDLNDEQAAVDAALDKLDISYSSLYGAASIEEREALLAQWRAHKTQAFVSKAVMYGAG